jgi:hypothetical protein
VRQALRVQDTVEALVVLVRHVNLNAFQERGARECREQALGHHVRADVDGAQLHHVAEGLQTCHRERSWQSDVLDRCVREGAVPDRLQLRGMGAVVLEGDLGERLA